VSGAHARAWCIGVVVPARNEEASIEACIDSVLLAGAAHRRRGALWIVVVADSCSDETAARARRALGDCGQVIETDVASAGAARRLGAAAVIERYRHVDASCLWLANTDADSCVCPDWIDVHLRLADQGVAGVAGIVRLGADGSEEAHEAFRHSYSIDADGTHPHVHGANIALRGDAYLDVGGWTERALAEDHCLWRRLRGRGWRVSSAASSVVITSARLTGRASGGFADTLKARIEARRATNPVRAAS
jgi:cellulose synthase/poly-beta-1,6-N-acetylglucosamine synthase-like glycosyltransferase